MVEEDLRTVDQKQKVAHVASSLDVQHDPRVSGERGLGKAFALAVVEEDAVLLAGSRSVGAHGTRPLSLEAHRATSAGWESTGNPGPRSASTKTTP